MADVSQGIALIPKSQIMNWELQRVIARSYDETPIAMPEVYGYGMPMIFGRNFLEKEMNKRPDGNSDDPRKHSRAILSSKEATISFLVGDGEKITTKIVQSLEEINKQFVVKMEKSREDDRGSTNDLQ